MRNELDRKPFLNQEEAKQEIVDCIDVSATGIEATATRGISCQGNLRKEKEA